MKKNWEELFNKKLDTKIKDGGFIDEGFELDCNCNEYDFERIKDFIRTQIRDAVREYDKVVFPYGDDGEPDWHDREKALKELE